MARYIDADLLKERLQKCKTLSDEIFGMGITRGVERAETTIDMIPTADVEEVKHGEWIQGVPYRCSICGNPAPEEKNTGEKYSCWLSPRCPHCGAKMDGEKR